MKYLSVLICIAFIFSCQTNVKNTNKDNDLEYFNLYGNVKSRKIKYFDVDTSYTKPVKVSERHEYKYEFDTKGMQLSKISLRDGAIKFSTKFDYDNKGILIKEITHKGNQSFFEMIKYYYNDLGQCIEEHDYDREDRIGSKTFYEYDNTGNKIRENFSSERSKDFNKLSVYVIYKYNNKGFEIERSFYTATAKGRLEFKRVFEYDNYGNIIKEYRYDQFGKLEYVYKYYYDKYNNILKREVFEDGEKSHTTKNKYKYDRVGNWIKKEVSNNGKLSEIVEQNIVYF